MTGSRGIGHQELGETCISAKILDQYDIRYREAKEGGPGASSAQTHESHHDWVSAGGSERWRSCDPHPAFLQYALAAAAVWEGSPLPLWHQRFAPPGLSIGSSQVRD